MELPKQTARLLSIRHARNLYREPRHHPTSTEYIHCVQYIQYISTSTTSRSFTHAPTGIDPSPLACQSPEAIYPTTSANLREPFPYLNPACFQLYPTQPAYTSLSKHRFSRLQSRVQIRYGDITGVQCINKSPTLPENDVHAARLDHTL
jgi:hypothetical protein